RTIWIADAYRGNGKLFVVQGDEKLIAFLELELPIRARPARLIARPNGFTDTSSSEVPISNEKSRAKLILNQMPLRHGGAMYPNARADTQKGRVALWRRNSPDLGIPNHRFQNIPFSF